MKQLIIVLAIVLTAGSVQAQTVEELIAKADSLAMEAFDNEGAMRALMKAEELSPNDWEVLWRLSRTYVDMGEHLPGETDQEKAKQLGFYNNALDYANKAVELAPDQSVTYLRRAIANGRIALFEGVFSAAGIVNDVHDDLEKALQLGNGGDFIQAVVHYVLGRTHAKLSEKPYLVRMPLGLGWGDIDLAFEHYEKALALRDDYRMFHLDYARALMEEDRYEEAKEHLEIVPTLTEHDEDDPKFAEQAAELLVEVNKELE